jgi:hypothetical protein
MKKKRYHSQLFRRIIEKNENDYEAKVIAELLYRIREMEREKCSCMKCNEMLDVYRKYYEKLVTPRKNSEISNLSTTI